jgi:predicted nucleic acid-binding protein
MAAPGKKKLLALDTNLLFDLAADKDFAHTFREVYQERGYVLVVPPTVIHELAYCALEKQCPETPLALKALQQMRFWNLSPFDLKSVGHGITKQFSEKLLRVGLLPEGEFHDGLILAETALANIPALVTSDADLLDIDASKLAVEFEAADLPPVQICHPKLLLKAMAPKR